MKKVVVFGANGFAGRVVCQDLKDNGYDVYEVSHDKESSYYADICQKEDVEHIILQYRPDYIVNLAAISSIPFSFEHPQRTISVNVIGSVNILEAVRRSEKKIKVILVGSSEQYGLSEEKLSEDKSIEPRNIYGMSKTWQEDMASLYVEKYDMSVICVRAFNHTGRDQSVNCVIPSFCKQVADIQRSGMKGYMYVGNIDIFRDFLDVRDVARAYRMLFESEIQHGVYNICRGEVFSLRDILNTIISFSDYEIEIIIDGSRVRSFDKSIICGDNSKICEDIGWYPQITLADMLQDIYNKYLQDGSL